MALRLEWEVTDTHPLARGDIRLLPRGSSQRSPDLLKLVDAGFSGSHKELSHAIIPNLCSHLTGNSPVSPLLRILLIKSDPL